MLSFIISYPDLMKFPYVADITERRDRGGAKAELIRGEREGDFFPITLIGTLFILSF
jgi:hypothetical protein